MLNRICLTMWIIVAIGIFSGMEARSGETTSRSAGADTLIARIDDAMWKDTLSVSPDSRHAVYGAQAGKKKFLVVDGKVGKPYDCLLLGQYKTIIFWKGGKFMQF